MPVFWPKARKYSSFCQEIQNIGLIKIIGHSRITMNWLPLVILAVIVVALLIGIKNTKEGFVSNSPMYEQWLFGNNNYIFNRDVVDKGIPVNDGIDVDSSFNRAVANPDVDLPTSPDRDYTSFFTPDPTSKYKAQDAYCKTITRPIDFAARTKGDVHCGWWFISEPTIGSMPALGTADAPLFPQTLPRNGYWVWDVNEAQMLEDMKSCNRAKSCSALELDSYKGQCGWCDYKNYSVPIVNGKEKYHASSAACGEKLIVDANLCDKPTQPKITAADGTLCGIYGRPSADNRFREYTQDECDSLLGTYTMDGSCFTSSGLLLNDECRGLNEPENMIKKPVVNSLSKNVTQVLPMDTNRSLLPPSQLGLFGGEIVRSDMGSSTPQTLNDACTPNSNSKMPVACIKMMALSLGFDVHGALLRVLENSAMKFTDTEELALNILISDGLNLPSGGLFNMTDKKAVGNFLDTLYGKMLKGSSQLVKAAATVFVNGDTTTFDPCNPNNPPIMFNGEKLFKDEGEMRDLGWRPINGIPYGDIIPCLKDLCMAWIPDKDGSGVYHCGLIERARQ